ncbi:MAG: NFACT family protein [Clostridia bacterium]|nr:NFACT family protein [Clostridia bacterium]
MALDGLTLNFIKEEIAAAAVGCRIEKVHQPSREELVLVLRGRNGAHKLLLSARANSPKIHFTAFPPENPAKPPMLCMLLRKHLTNAMLTAVRQEGLERALFLDFDATNEIGEPVKLTLCIEIMAQYSNIILINEQGNILDAVKRVDSETSSVRQILPGMLYKMPPKQNKPDLTDISADGIAQAISDIPNKAASNALLGCVQGISPIVCREIVSRAIGEDKRTEFLSNAELNAIAAETQKLKTVEPQPCAVIDAGGKPLDFSFFPITQYGDNVRIKYYETFSELLDDFYYEKDRIERTKQNSSELQKLVSNLIQRTARKLDLQRKELEDCADREQLKINAELIAANIYQLQKGAPFYEVYNYYTNENIRINANPALTPNENSQRYYKEYRKAKTAEQMLTTLIANGEEELTYLDTVADALSRAETTAQIAEIKQELAHTGYLKNKQKPGIKAPKPLAPMEYESSDGFMILVGRNNEQNDRLSLKTAAKNDIWLHTQKFPGSHTIIVTEGEEIPESTLVEAAIIAAYHSRARQSSGVPVDYTQVRNLKKPQGAKPGKVIYHVYNTLYVTPDRDFVNKLSK